MAMRRAGKRVMGKCLYQDFLDEHRLFRGDENSDSMTPCEYSQHAAHIHVATPSGTGLALDTSVVSPFFSKSVHRGVASALTLEKPWNSVLASRVRLSSHQQIDLATSLQASKHWRFTLDAHESATEKLPTSFARIGCEYRDDRVFAGVKIDAVNGPTLEAVGGVQMGDVAVGALGAYDVGLDHSDRLGRVTDVRVAASYEHDDIRVLLLVDDKGKQIKLGVAHDALPTLTVGSEFALDVRKDHKVLRLRSQYDLSDRERVACAMGSDGVLIGAYEWRTSPHLKTRVSAQMDVRNFDSDSHHLGVSIEIS